MSFVWVSYGFHKFPYNVHRPSVFSMVGAFGAVLGRIKGGDRISHSAIPDEW